MNIYAELIGNYKNQKIKSFWDNKLIRSNLNWYDEAGKIEKEFYALTKPFAVQNTDFITGKGVSGKCYPKQFPNQIILSSSAEDIFTELFAMYKQGVTNNSYLAK